MGNFCSCEYTKIKRYYSTDSGQSWIFDDTTVPIVGQMIGFESCGIQKINRFVQVTPTLDPSTYVCVKQPDGTYNKYFKLMEEQQQCDGTWLETGNYTVGNVIEYGSSDCIPFGGKFKLMSGYRFLRSGNCSSSSDVMRFETSAYSAFCTSVVIGDCCTSIGSNVFYNFFYLVSVTIPDSVRFIGHSTFSSCHALSYVTNLDSVTAIGKWAFSECWRLNSVTIGSGITSIGDSAFDECLSLTSITVLNPTPPTLGYGVFNNTNDCPIYVPAGSVSAYQSAPRWSDYASRIFPAP